MSEYWKSIPKKHCDVCNVWYQDNKVSVQHHEGGFKHKANVQRKLNELRRRGETQKKEDNQHRLDMMKIEAAALSSFQKDVKSDPSRATEVARNSHLLTSLSPTSSSLPGKSRFGEESGQDSMFLQKARESALESVQKKLEKKSKWLERKTAEGDVFYFNKETFESSRDKPKDGFVPLAQQDGSEYDSLIPSTSESAPAWQSAIPDPFGRWEKVKTAEQLEAEKIDLQLPKSDEDEVPPSAPVSPEVPAVVEDNPIIFAEKTLDQPLSKSAKAVEFKKRKFSHSTTRNVRARGDR